MIHEPMTLETDDPKEALRQIANYLRCTSLQTNRAVKDYDNDGQIEILGYWQTEEYLKGLFEIADECDRIRSLPQ